MSVADRTNGVRGCPGWFYGIRVRHIPDQLGTRVTFALTGPKGVVIDGLEASAARTTTLARKMKDKRKGYQHVAREAINGRID